MNSPQWPGPPPGGHGFPPPPPLPGGPGLPPPRPRGGSGLIVLLIFGVVAVLAIAGIGAAVVLSSDDDPDPQPTTALPTRDTYQPTPSEEPTTADPTPTTERVSDPSAVLTETITTAKGNTFTRAGTRTASCTSRANTILRSTLNTYPCVSQMYSAVYANPSRLIITSISIARFSSPTAAAAVSRVTNTKGWPLLLTPSDASGLRQPQADPAYWTRSWTQGSTVIYAQSYWSTGSNTGGRTGSVFVTAGEIGTEVTNTLLWTD